MPLSTSAAVVVEECSCSRCPLGEWEHGRSEVLLVGTERGVTESVRSKPRSQIALLRLTDGSRVVGIESSVD